MFAVALMGENVFQALGFTAAIAIAFETIGRGNPLAATTYCLMISASNIPIFYMLFVDGWGYGRGGIMGSYIIDAGCSLVAAGVLAALIIGYGGQAALKQAPLRT